MKPTDGATNGALPRAAVRVRTSPARGIDGPTVVVEAMPGGAAADGERRGVARADHTTVSVRLRRLDGVRAVVSVGDEPGAAEPATHPTATRVLLLPPARATAAGPVEREIVVGGWSVAVLVEPERRAALRERATRDRSGGSRSGPTELRAVIPGRVLAISVAAGDRVAVGQQLLVVEAMKMQNELRSPREASVGRVAVASGQTIEVGDLLVVLE